MNLRLFLLSIAVLSVAAGPLAAQKIPGSDAAEFVSARERWLADEEATSLPDLNALARTGNVAARLLIGLIDKNHALQGPWMALLPKAERIGLLRAEGGLSGTSWLRKVEGIESIELWLAILDSEAGLESALRLAELGEDRLSRAGLIALEARQMTGFSDYADDGRFPGDVRYLIWREWQKNGLVQDVSTALSGLDPGDPQRGLLREAVPPKLLEGWLLASDLAAPLKALCLKQCPQSEGSCLRAGFSTLGGYRRYATQGTPLAALIPEREFALSQRGQRSVLRRALGYAFLTESRIVAIEKIDMCFARMISDEGQNF